MKKYAMVALSSVALAACAKAADDQSYFSIFAETKVMRIAGMKAPKMPKLPPGFKMPAGIQIPGAPSRLFNVRLWAPLIAPDSASATLAPPDGLKLGSSLALDLFRPEPTTPGTGGGGGGGNGGSSTPPDMTIKVYWGSSETVKDGQPKIFKITDLAPEQMMEMSKRMAAMNPMASESYFYKANWTTGYWPPAKQKGAVDDDASLVGTYKLDSTFAGKVALDVPSGIDFLAPIDVTSPDLTQKVNMDNSIPFQWTPISGSLGAVATVFGVEGKNTIILWCSAEIYNANLMTDNGFLEMAQVRQRVQEQSFMGPDTSRVSIPAGIFKDADVVMLNMVAYGPGAATDKTQPLARMQTKTTLNLMLGGKKAK